MSELEELQRRHREEAARKRAKVKERKQRTHRLIERGAILESVIREVQEPDQFSNDQLQKILWFALLSPESIQYIIQTKEGQR